MKTGLRVFGGVCLLALALGYKVMAEEEEPPVIPTLPEPVSATSDPITLDTRTMGIGHSEPQEVDTRGMTVAWSNAIQLNTKAIIGTMLILQ